MTDVFEEVEEEIRSERLKRLARQWLPIVGGILAVALIAALAWWGWQAMQTGRAHDASVAYQRGLEALQTGNQAGAESAFTEAAEKGNGAYKALALQQRAGIAVAANRIPDAIALFDQAADAAGDPILADPARFKAALLVMDTGTLDEIETRLEPLTEEGRPMRPFAQEALGLARLQFGQPAEARELFTLLTLGQDVPEAVRQRAQAAIGLIDSETAAGIAAIVAAQQVNPPAPVLQGPPVGETAPAQAPAEAPAP
ncbi:tetratricopeptide repeat protein [Brevundimonas aurifodinae]|uniref:Ancillary SecYEG translocon subunit n=2 Tax=Brevundimonas TaxID=41275 RepID=A0ABV1NNW8_9CAUL|nr:MAG: hypothetical protein B7Z42_07140 [Brevundimonas sp. 12-68-7]OYX34383.1 MAG: hypothetical protein B7Z01_05915 [Brevundimonas subvibrioides]